MKKIIITLLLFSSSVFSQDAPKTVEVETKKEIYLDEGLVIKFSIDNDISGKDVNIGDKINFTTTEDIIQGNTVVLKKGLKVLGTIKEAAKSKGLGKKGKLEFSIDYLYLNDGKVVKLQNDVKKNLNGSGVAVVATSIILSPLALFIKGKNAKFKKGDLFEAYVSEKTLIN